MVDRPVYEHGIRQAVVWLLTLLLTLGHDMVGPARSSPEAPLWRASDICSVGHDVPSPGNSPSSSHERCVAHCGFGTPGLAPNLSTAEIGWVATHVVVTLSQYHGPSSITRRSANAPRAPPFLS